MHRYTVCPAHCSDSNAWKSQHVGGLCGLAALAMVLGTLIWVDRIPSVRGLQKRYEERKLVRVRRSSWTSCAAKSHYVVKLLSVRTPSHALGGDAYEWYNPKLYDFERTGLWTYLVDHEFGWFPTLERRWKTPAMEAIKQFMDYFGFGLRARYLWAHSELLKYRQSHTVRLFIKPGIWPTSFHHTTKSSSRLERRWNTSLRNHQKTSHIRKRWRIRQRRGTRVRCSQFWRKKGG